MTSYPSKDALWASVSDRLRAGLTERTFAAWFGAARAIDAAGGTLDVAVPNEFTRAWITGHFGDLIDDAGRAAGAVAVRFSVASESTRTEVATDDDAEVPDAPTYDEVLSRHRSGPDGVAGRFLPKYTFDSFVIGPSNRFSHAAALAVAEAPAQAYNPVLVYGGTGLGKTHLLQAIGQYISQHTPNLRARYLTSETFTNEFIDALRDRRMDTFKQRYRMTYDVLLVDDVQFLGGRERIQDEFFHTFNALYEDGRQVVLASDRPPKEIEGLEERLRSRFEWGLITDVQPPDLETRIAILRKRVAADGVRVEDGDVLTAIARRVTANIRELEGALTRVLAYASLTGRPISGELVRETLHDLDDVDAPVSTDTIQKVVAEAFGISIVDLVSQRRTQAIVHPRQIAMYLCRELTDASLPAIGRSFGGRDHTTVLYAVNKIAARLREDRREYDLVRDLVSRAKRRAS